MDIILFQVPIIQALCPYLDTQSLLNLRLLGRRNKDIMGLIVGHLKVSHRTYVNISLNVHTSNFCRKWVSKIRVYDLEDRIWAMIRRKIWHRFS